MGGTIEPPPVPEWACGADDLRHLLRWDNTQYIVNLVVNDRLIMGIVDMGAYRTVIDTKMAEALGLQVRTAGAHFGKFSVPGSDALHRYAGVVDGDTVLQVFPSIAARITNLRVIDHPHPFLLVGSDVLQGGSMTCSSRGSGLWNFRALVANTVEEGRVQAHIEFESGGEHLKVPLPPAGA